jgi:hypothetical protein
MSVTNLQHIGLEVPDIEAGLAYYNDAGLEAAARAGIGAVRCHGRASVSFVAGRSSIPG